MTSLPCVGMYPNVVNNYDFLPSPAFMLNMRGSDIPFNSLFYAYLFVGLESTILFVDANKVQDDMTEYLSSINVQRRDYNDVWPFLQKREWGQGKVRVSNSFEGIATLINAHIAPDITTDFICDLLDPHSYPYDARAIVRRIYHVNHKRSGNTRVKAGAGQGQSFICPFSFFIISSPHPLTEQNFMHFRHDG